MLYVVCSCMTEEEEGQSQEQLLVVLRHLRRDKEVATTQAHSLEAKAAGLELQLQNTHKQVSSVDQFAGLETS